MASTTAVNLEINGIDRTRGVLATLQTRLRVMAARIRVGAASLLRGIRSGVAALPGLVGGVFSRLRTLLLGAAGAAAALGAATVGAARSFSTLSDRAAQAGTTSDELDRLTTALSIGGAKNANIDTVADAFARMTKATGRTGMEGFRETLATIAAIGDEAGRVQELSRVFGRAFGPSLAAFVRQGPDALRTGLDGVMGALSRVSNDAVAAGDAIADGFDIAKRGILRSIQQVLVGAASRAFGKIGLDARGAGVLVAGYAEVYGGVLMRNLGAIYDRIKTTLLNLPTLAKNILSTIGAYLKLKVAEWAEGLKWISAALAAISAAAGALPVAIGLVGATAGFALMEDAAAGAQRELDELAAQRSEIFSDVRPLDFSIRDDERRRLDEVRQNARKITGSMDQLVTGAAAVAEDAEDAAASSVRGALGPLQSARATLAGTYDAYKIASQGASSRSPAQRAEIDTATNTAAIARNTERQSRQLEKLTAALESGGDLYVLA